jgi:hypothetical protein
MKRLYLALTALAVLALNAVGGCNDSYDSTRLVVINNSSRAAFVEVDEHADGDIDASATLLPGERTDWVLDAGWAVVFVDGDGVDIFLDDRYDGIFEIADD